MARLPRIGMLTPSSNTVLEPECYAMMAGVCGTIHFSRFPVMAISLDRNHRDQFALAPMLQAARLLQHAQCDVIAWNGTSAGWLGLDADRTLCQAITEQTGIPAISTTQALLQATRVLGLKEIGLVTPYEEAVAHAIMQTLAVYDLRTIAERHLGLRRNREFAEVEANTIAFMIRDVAARTEAVVVYCTNLAGAPLVSKLEAELGIPVLDSVTLTLWAALSRIGLRHSIAGWGRLLSENPPFEPVWPSS